MNRSIRASVLGTLLSAFALFSTSAEASSFDGEAGEIRFDEAALATYGFEKSDAVPAGAQFAKWTNGLSLVKTTVEKDALEATLSDDSLQGGRSLVVQGGNGLLINDQELFTKVAKLQIEVSLWAKSSGNSASFSVAYGKAQTDVYESSVPYVQVRAIRTGRETSDGWVEYSSGPIDGSIWGVPLASIMLLPSRSASSTGAVLVDAVEVKQVGSAITEAKACTVANVDSVCGAGGDCMFGHCISSAATWGALPPVSHRRELVERWIHIGSEIQGDRNTAKIASTTFATSARELATSAVSSRQFFGGLNRLVNLWRNNHTSFGGPVNFTNFAPTLSGGTSSSLRACFGVVEKDIAGGGQAIAVFRAGENPLSNVPLKVGDILTSIDGRDPKEWLSEVYPSNATTLPNDPLSDLSTLALNASTLITIRATNITVSRCKSSTQCDAANRTEIPIEVASRIYGAITGTVESPDGERFGCTARFTPSVSKLASSKTGEDPVSIETGALGETIAQFDGFSGQDEWEGSMKSIFDPRPAKVIMDARMGHGGYYSAVKALFNLMRGTSEPFGVLSVGRAGHDDADASWLFTQSKTCLTTGGGLDWGCFGINANGLLAAASDPPGATSKVAWLNSVDVSANDFMPKLLKGRSKVRIFGPHPTSGAFGAVISLPGMVSGFQGGSIQIQDSRFGTSADALLAADWESGHGVPPDEVVAQKLSDAINGVDTILTVAKAWVNAP